MIRVTRRDIKKICEDNYPATVIVNCNLISKEEYCNFILKLDKEIEHSNFWTKEKLESDYDSNSEHYALLMDYGGLSYMVCGNTCKEDIVVFPQQLDIFKKEEK